MAKTLGIVAALGLVVLSIRGDNAARALLAVLTVAHFTGKGSR